MLSNEQISCYKENGYVKIEQLFSKEETEDLVSEMIRVIEQWGQETIGWVGPWRDHYLDPSERLNTKAVFMHNPQHYSATWGRVIFHEGMVACLRQLIDGPVQYHHTVLHAKPPDKGTPFPLHQDYPFYPHTGMDFVDCLLHLDDTPLESGALMVVPGSHKLGPIEHVLGPDTAPHLPLDKYHPENIESMSIPAQKGDVIFFNYQLIHWSDCNRTEDWRKSVRFGYHSTLLRPIGRGVNNPYWIDPNNILERNNNIIVAGFRDNDGESAVK